jgi:hypothetical protein
VEGEGKRGTERSWLEMKMSVGASENIKDLGSHHEGSDHSIAD